MAKAQKTAGGAKRVAIYLRVSTTEQTTANQHRIAVTLWRVVRVMPSVRPEQHFFFDSQNAQSPGPMLGQQRLIEIVGAP